MIRQHKLDVRTVTMGVDLSACASPDLSALCARVRERLLRSAGRLRQVRGEVGVRYRSPIVNRRIAVSPVAGVASAHGSEGLVELARTLDAVANDVEVDLVGGFSAQVQQGWTEGARRLIGTLPQVLST